MRLRNAFDTPVARSSLTMAIARLKAMSQTGVVVEWKWKIYGSHHCLCVQLNARFFWARRWWTLRSAPAAEQATHYMCQQQACQRAEHPQAAPPCLIAAPHCRRLNPIRLCVSSTASERQQCPCSLLMLTAARRGLRAVRCEATWPCKLQTEGTQAVNNPECEFRCRLGFLTI